METAAHPKENREKPNFIFVTNTGASKTKNTPARRSHVMQSYVRSKAKSRSLTDHKTPVRTSLSDGKLTFRLGQSKRNPPDRPIGVKSPRLFAAPASGRQTLDLLYSSEDPSEDPLLLKLKTLGTNDRDALIRLARYPPLFFGQSSLDVFGTLPVTLSPWDEMLLVRFSHIRKWPWCPVSGQSLWPYFALSSKLVFSATMYSWCMAFRSRLAVSEVPAFVEKNPEILQHKLNAISLINSNLSDYEMAVKDETIATVAAMTNVELVFGNRETASIHIKGLRDLVYLRGGFLTFATPLQQLIQRLISWSDLTYSGMFQTPLYFPAVELWDVAWHTLDQFSLPGSPLCLAPTQLRLEGIPHHEVIELMESTRRLCSVEQQHPLIHLNEHDRMHLADMCMALETRLSRIIHATTPIRSYTASTALDAQALKENCADHSEANWTLTVWRASALATLIYVHHVLRGSSLHAKRFGTFAELLQETLARSCCAMQRLGFSQALVLWVLAIGGVASQARADGETHAWFVLRMREACSVYGVRSYEELCVIFQSFIWSGIADEVMYRELWREVDSHL